jgi:hypothetical protein
MSIVESEIIEKSSFCARLGQVCLLNIHIYIGTVFRVCVCVKLRLASLAIIVRIARVLTSTQTQVQHGA